MVKRLNRLPPKAGRDLFTVQAVLFRPMVRVIIRSEDFVDPRKVDSKILVDPLFLGRVVPMMISGHHEILFEPFNVRAEIAVRPGRVEGHKNQVRENDRLRKSEHERDEDEAADQGVIDKV